jgi:predicted ester cyclase
MRQTLLITALLIFLASCKDMNVSGKISESDNATAKLSNQERNKQIIMACLDNINKHNADSALKEADASFIDYSDGSMPPMKGDSAKMVLKVYLSAFPDMKNLNPIYCADGDYVMVYSDVTGTWTGDLMGMKATGRSMKIKDVDVFKFNAAGKIIEHHNVQSVPCVMASLGASMPASTKK